MTAPPTDGLVHASRELTRALEPLRFAAPVAHVYRPLVYARPPHEAYLRTYGRGPKRVVFLGMNPGPWGMAQTGVPFGEVAAVRDWMGVQGTVDTPSDPHPKRPVTGFACPRNEVSGRRLWGLMADRFGTAAAFFAEHFVVNYCPLVFMDTGARNLTPDRLPAAERRPLEAACDRHLAAVLRVLRPAHVVGVGQWARKRADRVVATPNPDVRTHTVLHPSPASPAANRGWAAAATRQLVDAGVWV